MQPFTKRPLVLLAISLVHLFAAASTAGAQVTWTQVTPTARITPDRNGASMAYDAARGRTILFGGVSLGVTHGETWGWDGSTWTLLATTGPRPRYGTALAYDAARQRIVLFGGVHGGVALDDTWEWDGTTWSERQPATRPPGRSNHEMAYYPPTGCVVLAGGYAIGDTWSWDGTTWTQAAGASFGARQNFGMAYYGRSRRLVARGGVRGTQPWDTQVWDGQSWSLPPAPTGSLPLSFPFGIAEQEAVYDARRDRVVSFGGRSTILLRFETQEWSGLWLDNLAPGNPPPRTGHAMAYDSGRDRVVLYGGFGVLGATLGDTWEMHSYTPVPPFAQPSLALFGNGCAGEYGTPFLTAVGFPPGSPMPWVGSSWPVGLTLGSLIAPPVPVAMLLGVSNTTWGPVQLPFSLAGIGSPGCELLVSPDVILPGTAISGGATWTLQLPRCATCAGAMLYVQGLASTGTGLSVSNGVEFVMGQR